MAALVRAISAILLGLVFCLPAAGSEWVRPAYLAGTWYPSNPQELQASLDAYLAGGQGKALPGQLKALVSPHAGIVYSGKAAGAAWAQAARLKPSPHTVIILGPAHRHPLDRPSIWPQGAYASPLGEVPIDQALAAEVAKRVDARFVRAAHHRENSLELQIPFLRRALPKASLVPILTGAPNLFQARLLGQELAKAMRGRPVLLVASTDFSHFHDLKTTRVMDDRAAACMQALDPEGLVGEAVKGKTEACGLQGLLAVMFAAQSLGADEGVILAKDDSARITGDKRRVVGYLAAVFVAKKGQAESGPKASSSPLMNIDEKHRRLLRDLAARSIKAAVLGQPSPVPPSGDPVLATKAGAFVTLRKKGRLRGCIGHIMAFRPLGRTVVEMAAAAATQDPRFSPVRPEELDGLELEISVLTPLAPCALEQVRVGTDGLLIQMGGRSGLLLPQVPTELGWDREQFLEGLCQKAGLPPGSWRKPEARLYRFQAVVF